MTVETPTAFGIDLGTTFSVVAQVNKAGLPNTLPNAEGSPTTPSIVLFDGDQVVVGAVAREAIATDPEFVVQLAKRRLGSDWAFEYRGVAYRAEHISGLLAKKLVQDGQRLAGPVADAVVTVPAYFNDSMRSATRHAVELGGARVLGLLSEPTAAAIAFGYDQRPEEARGIVVDLGGGTFDVTVLELDHEHLSVQSTGGDAYLGGANFDKVLFDHFVEEFEREHGIDIRDPDALSVEDFTLVSQDWLMRAGRAKHDLSVRDHTIVQLQAVGLSFRVEVTQLQFESLAAVLLDEVTEKILEVVNTGGYEPRDIDVILAVGGATRIPMVQARIRSLFGSEPDTSIRPDEAVALGAAVEATRLQLEDGAGLVLDPDARQYLETMTVTDVSAHSLGVSVFAKSTDSEKHVEILLPRNTSLPYENSRRFYTRFSGETRIVIPILEGESSDPDECKRLGQLVIDGLPADRPAFQPVSVTMIYNRDGILEVTAKDEETGALVATTIERTGSTSSDAADCAVRNALVL